MPGPINELKKTVFSEILNMAGRVFTVVRYSERVVIGKRGFTPDEMKNGIVLVFNSRMNFSWDDAGISASLVFGSSAEQCFIPADDIIAIYSPELQTQFIVSSPPPRETPEREERKTEKPGKERRLSDSAKVVKVDFRKKRDRTSSHS